MGRLFVEGVVSELQGSGKTREDLAVIHSGAHLGGGGYEPEEEAAGAALYQRRMP